MFLINHFHAGMTHIFGNHFPSATTLASLLDFLAKLDQIVFTRHGNHANPTRHKDAMDF